MYVSTREGGTCAFRTPNPKELHEMEWQIGIGRAGKFVKEEQVVPATPPSQAADASNCNDNTEAERGRVHGPGVRRPTYVFRALKSGRDAMRIQDPRERRPENRRRVWLTNMFGLETALSLRERPDPKPVPLPEGCVTPHPIFARKFSLIADSQPLPPSLSHEMMPTADTKARKLLADAAVQGVMGPSYEFRGPFTPQLGFDGGLDHRQVVLEPCTAPSRANGRALHHKTASPRRQADVESPRQTRTPRSQRGHDWFGLDTAYPGPNLPSHSPQARSAGPDSLPGTAYSEATKRDSRPHPQPSNNWFGLDGAADDCVDSRPSEVDRVRCRSMVRSPCGVAAKDDGSHAPADFGLNVPSTWSAARHSEQWQQAVSFSNTGGKLGVPDHRWLVDDNPRIHPVRIVDEETHKLRHAPSLDQLRSPTLSAKRADSILLQSWTTPDDDGVQKVATEVMLGKARELTITKQQPVLRDVGRASRSSGMASSERSGKLSHSRASSRPSSSSRQDTTQSGRHPLRLSGPAEALGLTRHAQARHQPSFSDFYAYVQGDCSRPGSANGSQVGVGGVRGSQASYSDYQAPEARRGQGESRSDAGLSCPEMSYPSQGESEISASHAGDHETALSVLQKGGSSRSSEDSAISDEDYEEQRISQTPKGT
ncbi:uncharacterized protein ColSpa_09614 [Colletotrichum spaethianum]|uniref:Uncharacterized protein n=1 Tax=Colletotrichum spaethianum TaxID=700344 RepID=A0AA37PBW6_9PEZI|nr:uncharacterized protein ColSpa_09614 [Colletotrichum spaethianum]GKT49433.1 hypothetical protein ColSpa_09614 [Colletotrichum spaethianum]